MAIDRCLMRFGFSLTLLLFSIISIHGQVVVHASPDVEAMMEKFVENGYNNEDMRAWRIQIITTDDRRKMEEALAKFKSLYPVMEAQWSHIAPYYQVRVGLFDKKIKLMPFLLELKKHFPSATPVYDKVNKKSLLY